MQPTKILVLSGSTRTGSLNTRLAALAVKELTLMNVVATQVSLADYPMPIYDADLEKASGVPEPAVALKRVMDGHHGVFITGPEYNASVTPLLKNAIDWLGNVRTQGEAPLAVYQDRAFAIGAASPGPSGGVQSLIALRQVLAVGCRALVVGEQVGIPFAKGAFDDADTLKDPMLANQLRLVLRKLVTLAQAVGRVAA